MFASQLHTHLTGKRAYTKHYRNGVELPELVRDNHYSPHYQEMRKLQRWVHVLPVRLATMLTLDMSCVRCGIALINAFTSTEKIYLRNISVM